MEHGDHADAVVANRQRGGAGADQSRDAAASGGVELAHIDVHTDVVGGRESCPQWSVAQATSGTPACVGMAAASQS